MHCNVRKKVRKTELLSGLKIVESSSSFYPRRPASKFQKFWAKNKTEVECLLSHFGTFRIYSHLWGRAAGVGCRSPLFGCLLFSMKLIIVSHRSHLSVWQRPVFNGKFDNDERQLLPKKPKFPLTVKCPAAAERTAFWSEDIWSKHLVTSAYWPVRDIFKPLVQNQLQKLILIRFVSSLVQTSFLIACSLLVWALTNTLWHTQRCSFFRNRGFQSGRNLLTSN